MKNYSIICESDFGEQRLPMQVTLCCFSMMAIMFTKDARFADLKRKLEVVKQKKSKLLSLYFL
jgi:hypothetical protein